MNLGILSASTLAFFALVTALGSNPACGAEEDGVVVKAVLDSRAAGPNLLVAKSARPYESGFVKQGATMVCDNGTDGRGRRGAVYQLELNQTNPLPIVASAWCRAENVGGARDGDFSIYLDLVYADGTPLWGQIASFSVGTHQDERREVTVFPEKPIKSVSFYLLLRGHSGRAVFRDPELRVIQAPVGAAVFDGVPVSAGTPASGFQVRDVAAKSDFVRISREALGISLVSRPHEQAGATVFDVSVKSLTTNDRAVTLVYALPVEGGQWRWLGDLRQPESVAAGREYATAIRQSAGMGRLSRVPFVAISNGKRGLAMGIDMQHPAFFRAGYNAATHELFIAFDLGLAPEKRDAQLRLVTFAFDPAWELRAALSRYYEIFPDQFACRVSKQGLWMPFAKISEVPHFEDFGFRFKEGNNETAWDDAHDILTFRYTEPMTWWMTMPTNLARTLHAAEAEANRLAAAHVSEATAFATSAFQDDTGAPAARLLDTPWCNGAVWSMNSMPGIRGDATDFKTKWNPQIRESLYGTGRKGDLDGEYIDSSEGYVTDELDFRREHFAAAQTPLTFSPGSFRPAIFRGLIAFEYVRGIAQDVHQMGNLMMANGTPDQLCWLAPMLDVLGTETDWNPQGNWRPMSDKELLFRRALGHGKPYCFLMNTAFDKLPHERVELYMRRCLAYGMFPGFFSADAATGQYFTRPELYERDRPLFKKYVPLCRRVAEAGWEPLTQARSSEADVHVERFGTRYLTVFNETKTPKSTIISMEAAPANSRDLVSGAPVRWADGKATVTLESEGVAVIDLAPAAP